MDGRCELTEEQVTALIVTKNVHIALLPMALLVSPALVESFGAGMTILTWMFYYAAAVCETFCASAETEQAMANSLEEGGSAIRRVVDLGIEMACGCFAFTVTFLIIGLAAWSGDIFTYS